MIGDIIGQPGRRTVRHLVSDLRREYGIDLVIANGENAAGGFGITGEICQTLYQLGADAITLGNHAWDQRETVSYIALGGGMVAFKAGWCFAARRTKRLNWIVSKRNWPEPS